MYRVWTPVDSSREIRRLNGRPVHRSAQCQYIRIRYTDDTLTAAPLTPPLGLLGLRSRGLLLQRPGLPLAPRAAIAVEALAHQRRGADVAALAAA